MDWIQIYFEFIGRLFIFFTLDFTLNNYDIAKKVPLRIIYVILCAIYAIPFPLPSISFIVTINEFLYLYIIGQRKLKHCFVTFLKYEMYVVTFFSMLYNLHCILINDFYYLESNTTYHTLKIVICKCLTYITLCSYIYAQRLFRLHEKRHYGILFSGITIMSCMILSYFSLQLISGQLNDNATLPLVFSFVFIAIAVCLSSYQQILTSLETNMNQKLLLTRYETEQQYYKDVEKSLSAISSMRHDFKNYLIIVDSYAKKKDYENLRAYLSKINSKLEDTTLIQTPNPLISAILNAKSNICQEKNVKLYVTCSFDVVSIDDFYLIAILGNMLDNAITAAAKMQDGYVDISIRQIKSFLEIICKNNHCETIRKHNSQFLSTKENANAFHGIGIKNIRNSVNALNGTMDISYNSCEFTMTLLLPNYF